MRPQLKTLCDISNMKTKEIRVDEHRSIGWTEITCTNVELENFVQLVIKYHDIIKTWDKDYEE